MQTTRLNADRTRTRLVNQFTLTISTYKIRAPHTSHAKQIAIQAETNSFSMHHYQMLAVHCIRTVALFRHRARTHTHTHSHLAQFILNLTQKLFSLSAGTFESCISTDSTGTHRWCNRWTLFVGTFQRDPIELCERQSLGIGQSKWKLNWNGLPIRMHRIYCHPFWFVYSSFKNCWCHRCPVEHRTYSMWSHITPKNILVGAGCVHCAIFPTKNECNRTHLDLMPNTLCPSGRNASATNRISVNVCRTGNHIKWYAIYGSHDGNSIVKMMPAHRCIKLWISIV